MLFASVQGEGKVEATPGARGRCPFCQGLMIARCGEINVWHWAHEATEACDGWNEVQTRWHYEWKRIMPSESVEVPIERGGELHIADIVRADGTVVKLQSSYISPEDIRATEQFYGDRKLVWLFDAREAAEDGPNGARLDLRAKGDIHTFRWKHPKKHTGFPLKPRLLDLGEEGVLRLRKLHLEGGPPYGGWGNLRSRDNFIKWLRQGLAV